MRNPKAAVLPESGTTFTGNYSQQGSQILLRVSDAARLLSVSVWKLRQLAYEREVVSVKVGSLLMFRPEDLHHFAGTESGALMTHKPSSAATHSQHNKPVSARVQRGW